MPTPIKNSSKKQQKTTTPPPSATPASKVETKVETKPVAKPVEKPAVTPPASPIQSDSFTKPATQVTKPAPQQPAKGAVKANTTVSFGGDWNQAAKGDLVAGGKMTIDYDLSRLPNLRNTHNGFPAWGITAYVMFQPSGKIAEGSVVQFESQFGRPTSNARPLPFTTEIPEGTTGVQVWFRNWTGADSPREAYDSNFGRNYRFDVRAPTKNDRG